MITRSAAPHVLLVALLFGAAGFGTSAVAGESGKLTPVQREISVSRMVAAKGKGIRAIETTVRRCKRRRGNYRCHWSVKGTAEVNFRGKVRLKRRGCKVAYRARGVAVIGTPEGQDRARIRWRGQIRDNPDWLC